MQEREPIVLSKVVPAVQWRVSSSYCLAPGIIVYTTTVLSVKEEGNDKMFEDIPWPLADLP